MASSQALARNLNTLAWGTIFIWLGLTLLFRFPHGTGDMGIGLVLLGLNAARALKGIPTSGFTITLGILAFAYGGLELTGTILGPAYVLPTLAMLLITLGVVLFGRVALRVMGLGRPLGHGI